MRTEDYIVRGLLAGVAGIVLGSTGCSSSSDNADGEGVGGSVAAGGAIADGAGGSTASNVGGTLASGGRIATGGTASGGARAVGGSPSTGGTPATGGTVSAASGGEATGGFATGGRASTGGTGSGGRASTGGTGSGGRASTGGTASGGFEEAGGAGAGGSSEAGGAANGGSSEAGAANGGAGAGGSTDEPLDCSVPVAMPTSAGTTHCGSYRTGRAGEQSWELWSNNYNGSACITYYDEPAFSAQWNNNNDFLARVGIEWGGTPISQLGEVTAEFMYTKSGSGGGFSYIGVYGWATSPCVEYYIIDDSYGGMPFSPWNMQQRGSATIDGEVYNFYSGQFGGTGGSRCTTPFQQYWSIRQSARECGVMSITRHFEEWNNAGMSMDNILEAKILVETGGGQGSIEFPVANVRSSL